MAHIYVKHTIWQKIYIHPDDEKKLEYAQSPDFDWGRLADNGEFEWDYDTVEFMTTEENDDQATVEVYDSKGDCVWTNEDRRIKRKEKIDKII